MESLQNQAQVGTTATTTLPINGLLLDPVVTVHGLKVRKAYTISKQREKWTDEEHQKFLDALKLYGRAWRQIQEFIGTKTAVQIRSHAQKFFSKVVQGGNDDTESHVAAIEIPPPRPKRKPTHPYPRKYVDPRNIIGSPSTQLEKRICSNVVTADFENQSPNSVLSASMTQTLEFPVSDMPDSCLSNSSCSSGTQSGNLFSVDREDNLKTINGSPTSTVDNSVNRSEATIMLFGQIVSTKDSKRPSDDGTDTFIPSEQHLDVNIDNKNRKLEESQASNGLDAQSSNGLYYGNWPWAWHGMNSDSTCASMQWMPIPLYTGLPPPFLISYRQNTASPPTEERTTKEEAYASSPKHIHKSGFVPYRRCSAIGSMESTKTVAEDEDGQRVQLCL